MIIHADMNNLTAILNYEKHTILKRVKLIIIILRMYY